MARIGGACAKCGGPTGDKRSKTCVTCHKNRGGEHVEKAEKPSPRLPVDYDEAVQLWRQIIGCTKREYKGPAKRRQSDLQRVAILSDIHAPFQDMRAFAAFIERERGADVCIVAGDLQDHYALSRFIKYENVPIHQELAAAQLIMEQLSEAFPIVLCIEGNHDKPRFEKLLYDRLPQDAIEVVRYLSRTGGLSTIEALASQFQNVELVKNKIDDRYTVSWYLQHGDLLVTHAEKFSRVPGSALRSIEEWATDFERTLKLKPWRVIVQAHTHQQSLFPWAADRWLVEAGCMCLTMGYQLSARLGGRPQRLGYTTLEQKAGVTIPESIRPVPLPQFQ
jgi:predicted phosphodiesterase